jgi:hypothetical protein
MGTRDPSGGCYIEPNFTSKTDLIIARYSGTNNGPPESRVWTDFNIILYSVKNNGPPSNNRFQTDVHPVSAVVTGLARRLLETGSWRGRSNGYNRISRPETSESNTRNCTWISPDETTLSDM